MEGKDPLAVEQLDEVELDGPEKFTYVRSLLSNEERKPRLRLALLCNIDVFSWRHSDMVRISPTVASHKLNVLPIAKPVRKRVRRFHLDRHQNIQTEVDNLLAAGFITEVNYPEWLANVVVVPKKGSKWRVCVDYIDLNEACPKYSFPLPRIDKIVDATVRNGILSFLDTFSKYNQIPMHPPDEEKTTSITPHELYYYNVILFVLKNEGATY